MGVRTDASSTMKVLAVDDDSQNLELITSTLSQPGLEIVTCTDPQAAMELFFGRHPQVVLLDLMMPRIGGMELLEQMVAADPAVDVILMAGHYSTESAVEAIQKGACDYLDKPIDLQRLRRRLGDLVTDAKIRQRASQLDHELVQTFQLEGIIGRSPLILEVFARIRRVAPHFQTVLITGPTGSGKELVARALHKLSLMSSGPFALCNCSAITETLVESELFGYVKGAFTGATQDKVGLFEYARGGTVFLDEIGELPPAAQAKILRVLQNQEIQPVGSPAVRKVNVRIVAATNRDLRGMVSERKFREDLYYRLSMVEIELPSLAERREDVPLLLRHFVESFSTRYKKEIRGITRRAQTLLARYDWPGNVRELQNVVGSACMMTETEVIDIGDLPKQLRQRAQETIVGSRTILPLEEMERSYVRKVLEQLGGNKLQAAEVLGISRGTLYKLLRESPAPNHL